VELRARIQGVLEHVRFEEGAAVKEGQVLFEIQRTQYEASLQSARAQLAKAQAELARAQEQVEVQRSRAELEQRQAALAKAKLDVARLKPLAQAKAVPQVDLDNALAAEQVAVAGVAAGEAALKDTELNQRIGIQQAQAAVEAGRAAATQAQLDLAYTTIRAPVSGISGGSTWTRATSSAEVSDVARHHVHRRSDQGLHDRERGGLYLRSPGAAGRTLPAASAARAGPGRRHAPPAQGSGDHARRTVDPKTGHDRLRSAVPNPEKLLRRDSSRASARRGRGA
jgi:hypothetical protein